MPRRSSRPRSRVQRLPLGLFGYRKGDVIEAASELEAEQQKAADALQSLADGQRQRIAQAVARRETLQEVLGRLKSDRERLERQLDQARRNAAVLDAGAKSEIAALQEAHDAEQARLAAYVPEVESQIAAAETEIRQLAQGLRRVLQGLGPGDGVDAASEFADVIAALCATPPEDLPVRRLAADRVLYAVPQSSVRLQMRGGAGVGTVHGVVASGLPPRVVGFAVSGEGADGVVPAADVVALLQGAVLVRDSYRIVDLADLPREAAHLIFSVARQQPAMAGAAAALPSGAWQARSEDKADDHESAAELSGSEATQEASGQSEGTAGAEPLGAAAPAMGLSADVEVQGSETGSTRTQPSEHPAAGQARTEAPPSPAQIQDEGPAEGAAAGGAGEPLDASPAAGAAEPGGMGAPDAPPATLATIQADAGPTIIDAEDADLTATGMPEAPAAAAETVANVGQATAAEAADGGLTPETSQAVHDGGVEAPTGSGPVDAGRAGPSAGGAGDDQSAAAAATSDGAEGHSDGAPAQAAAEPAAADSASAMQSTPGVAGGLNAEDAARAAAGAAPVPRWPADIPLPDWQMSLGAEGEVAASAEPSVVAQAESRPAAPVHDPGAASPAGAHGRAAAQEARDPARAVPPRPVGPTSGAASLNILAFIAGKVVGRDLVAPDGVLLAARGAQITPELVAQAETLGLLPEMIVYMTVPEAGR